MKAEDTPQSRLGDGRGRRKNCALSRNSVLKTALPNQHGAVKLNTAANIRLAYYFSPSLLSKDNNPAPQKLHHSCGSRMRPGRTRRFRISGERGVEQFFFPSLSKFPLRFYIPHWQTASRIGQGVPQARAPGRGESIGTKAFLVRGHRPGRSSFHQIPSEMMDTTPGFCQRRP